MQQITIDEVKSRMDAGENLNLLDVRENNEREEFNIGGRFIPLGRVTAMDIDDIEDLKNEELIVYCRSGNRSGQAATFLETMGFTNVKNLSGGMNAWRDKFTS